MVSDKTPLTRSAKLLTSVKSYEAVCRMGTEVGILLPMNDVVVENPMMKTKSEQ